MLRHFALITHAVPPKRVKAHLPEGFELDTWDLNGKPRALVSVGCFRNEKFGLAALNRPNFDFEQSTYRTYVKYNGVRGAYFFGTYLGNPISWAMQRAVASGAKLGRFEIIRNYNDSGYRRYSGAVHSKSGETRFELRANELPENDELTQFVTYRPHGFFKSSLGRVWDQPVEHARMCPFEGKLISGRFDPWDALDILSPEEAAHPISVLVQPSIHFLIKTPVPLSRVSRDPELEDELTRAA